MTTKNKRALLQETASPVMSTREELALRHHLHHASDAVVRHYRHLSPGKGPSTAPERFPIAPATTQDSMRLFLRAGSDRYRMTFCISGVRYTGSTLCEEHDLAVMVARVVYAEIKETAGRLSPDDVRRRERTVVHIRGCWLTSRPKLLPSVAGRTKPILH